MVLKVMHLPGITRGEQVRREEDEGLNTQGIPMLRGGGEKEEQVKGKKGEERGREGRKERGQGQEEIIITISDRD